MSKIYGLKTKKKTFPLIEILGQVDVGKKEIADLVSRKLSGTVLSFPFLFNLDSPTARILRASLIHYPRKLEANPMWWAHIYAAHLYEYKKQIEIALEHGPVVVTNYVMSFRVWARAASIDIDSYFDGFTAGLPQPNCAFSIIGEKNEGYRNLDIDFSPSLILSIDRAMHFLSDKRVLKKIDGIVKGQPKTFSFNQSAEKICNILERKYKLHVMNHIKFDPGSFPNKGAS